MKNKFKFNISKISIKKRVGHYRGTKLALLAPGLPRVCVNLGEDKGDYEKNDVEEDTPINTRSDPRDREDPF